MKQNLKDLTEKRTILIVEDNQVNREILRDLLADEYEILEAENGQTGLEKLMEFGGKISVILLDVFMPVCDGFTFLERMHETDQFDSVPVIVMTASEAVDDEIRCLRLGATDFVTKPYNIEVVKNRIRSMIRLRESSAMLHRLERDEKTGLYSKEFFYHFAGEVLRANPDTDYDLICSDVENFRAMNERYGHAQCDHFLKFLADSLQNQLPNLILGGRIGTDVYAFLIEHREDVQWEQVLLGWAPSEGSYGNFVVKYGLLEHVNHDVEASALCDRATLAIASIKGRFHMNLARFDEEMRQIQIREHQLVQGMMSSMKNREFQVYYQPKYDLRSDSVGGAEALVRWIHPELGFISPGTFIPLFEQNGFVTELDFYVWEETCREIRRLQDQGLPVVPISVNVSRLDFDVPDLAEQIIGLADRYGIEHSLLHIELTESFYGDNPSAIARTLQTLSENGFVIELDDFGSGYSTLSALSVLPLDVMKLDMSIIRQASATHDYSILRYCIILADGMRFQTVAEGVETQEEVDALRVLGCDYIQGYYFSKPLPQAEFEAYLIEHKTQ